MPSDMREGEQGGKQSTCRSDAPGLEHHESQPSAGINTIGRTGATFQDHWSGRGIVAVAWPRVLPPFIRNASHWQIHCVRRELLYLVIKGPCSYVIPIHARAKESTATQTKGVQ
ncbi:hypothetical protein NDU88_004689 [Pleurodeles waltl]|uniref:Uncharacterized protein n=1 Tax=Pleurodeles waltl TaxID=8319 RepID=A0AAV7UG27_PLEWA|nr:hypothetical protein NDU88_004689 [Pleurodeles waltl]